MSFVRHARGLRVQMHPLARAAVSAQLTPEESAHWQQAAVALVDAAAAADPKILQPYARSVPGTTSYGTGPDGPGTQGRRRIPGAWDLCRLPADAPDDAIKALEAHARRLGPSRTECRPPQARP